MFQFNKSKMAIPFLLLVASCLQAMSDISTIYSNGVKDTLLVGEKYLSDSRDNLFNKKSSPVIHLKGYAVTLEASKLNEPQIVRVSAIGYKNGFDTKLIKFNNKNLILFSVEDRKIDAQFVQKKLSKYNIFAKVVEIDTDAVQYNLIAKKMIQILKNNYKKILDAKENRIVELEDIIRNLPKQNLQKEQKISKKLKTKKTPIQKHKKKQAVSKNIIIKIGTIQVVNRVITDKYLKKYKKVEPLNNYAKKHLTKEKIEIQKKEVQRNIINDVKKPLPKIKSFSALYTYLRTHAGITKENILVLNGKGYKSGDKLLRWHVSKVDFKTGLVVLNNSYSVLLKQNKGK